MISEVRDQFELLTTIHKSIDTMISKLSKEQLVQKPAENFNNIISLIEHVTLTENRNLAGIGGGDVDIDIMAPFKADTWDVEQVLSDWNVSLSAAEEVFAGLTEEELSAYAVKRKTGQVLNKRQAMTFMTVHAAHHCGQIPLIKKLLGV